MPVVLLLLMPKRAEKTKRLFSCPDGQRLLKVLARAFRFNHAMRD